MFPAMKLCVEGVCSCNCLIVELSLVLLKQRRLRGSGVALPRRGRIASLKGYLTTVVMK